MSSFNDYLEGKFDKVPERPRVLVIDDEVAYTFLLKTALEETAPYEVRICNDSTRAESIAEEFQPDIILLDIVMPGLDGAEVSRNFRRNPKLQDIPIVLISALASRHNIEDGGFIVSDGDLLIAKPVSAKSLHQCLQNIFEQLSSNNQI